MKHNKLEMKKQHYHQDKAQVKSIEALISEKRKNLEKIIALSQDIETEKENQFHMNNFAKQVDQKHKKYLQDMDELQNCKFKIIEMKGKIEELKFEIKMQDDTIETWKNQSRTEQKGLEEILMQIKQKQKKEVEEQQKIYENRCHIHLAHIQQLTNQKEDLLTRSLQFLDKKKSFDLQRKKMKQNQQERLKKEKQQWVKAEKDRKDRWDSKKMQEISESTLKGIEPQIQRIVSSSKRQITQIQLKYQSITNQYKTQMNKQFESNIKQHRHHAFSKIEEEKIYINEKCNDTFRRQADKIQSDFEDDKRKIKLQREQEIQALEDKRKRQTQEFIYQNKDYRMAHINEVRTIKDSYQKEIRQLDGTLDKQISNDQIALKIKNSQKFQAYSLDARKNLQAKLRQFHLQFKKQSSEKYEDIVEAVACQNQKFESQVKLKNQLKLKEIKENFENEIKKIRKDMQNIEVKVTKDQESFHSIKQKREHLQNQYEEVKSQNDFLKRKLEQYQVQKAQMKVNQYSSSEIQKRQLQRVEQRWSDQLQQIRSKIKRAEGEIITQQEIMKQEFQKKRNSYAQAINQLEINSLNLIKKRNEEINQAKIQKQERIIMIKNLQDMKLKIQAVQAKRK